MWQIFVQLCIIRPSLLFLEDATYELYHINLVSMLQASNVATELSKFVYQSALAQESFVQTAHYSVFGHRFSIAPW